MKEETKQHKSYGMINVSRFSGGNCQFFDSDLAHDGGVSITISDADIKRKYGSNWVHAREDLIHIEMSHNQFVDAITSGMNTSGVPCTIKRVGDEIIPQIDHIEDKKEQFQNDMSETYSKYLSMIENINNKLEGNIGKKKVDELKHDLGVLRSHIVSNTNFVMKTFEWSMEKTVTEAKHSIANYIDHKIHSKGLEALRDELQISIESKEEK